MKAAAQDSSGDVSLRRLVLSRVCAECFEPVGWMAGMSSYTQSSTSLSGWGKGGVCSLASGGR